MSIILSKDATCFIKALPVKHARQIALKIKSIERREDLSNCKLLKGEGDKYYRVAVGEYRIIYQWKNDDVYIFLIGKRNDDEIYRIFERKK